jgi:prevent-host-death family protein
MAELTTIDLRDANQRFSKLVRRVEATGEGYLVLRHGRPVARLRPRRSGPGGWYPSRRRRWRGCCRRAGRSGSGDSTARTRTRSASSGSAAAAVAAERFGLDSNVLVYLVDGRDPPRQGRAREIIAHAAKSGRCLISVQSLGEFYVVAVRKGLVAPVAAQAVVDDLATLFSIASPTAADARAAVAAAVAGRFPYWDALLLATLGRAGCGMVLSEAMQDGAMFAGVTVRDPFAGERLPGELEALLDA